MKKILIASIFFISCNQSETINSANSEKIVSRKIDTLLTSIIAKYPNYSENEIVREIAASELNKKINRIQFDLLNDIPLKIFNMKMNPYGEGTIIQFYTRNYDYGKTSNSLSDKLEFELIGFVNQDLATTLDKNKKYFVFGKKYRRANDGQALLLVDQLNFESKTEIRQDVIDSKIFKFRIGQIICVVDSVKLIESEAERVIDSIQKAVDKEINHN